MKRFFAIIVLLTLMIYVFASCDNAANKKEGDTEKSDTPSEAPTEAPSEIPTQAPETSRSDENGMFGTYVRPNDDALSFFPFTITLNPDGSYSYYETAISSHMGHGKYTVEGNVITLIDEQIPTLEGAKTYYFRFEYRDGKLIYLADESDNFMYVHLPDGAEFEKAPKIEN